MGIGAGVAVISWVASSVASSVEDVTVGRSVVIAGGVSVGALLGERV